MQCQEAQFQKRVWSPQGCLAVRTCHNPFRQGYDFTPSSCAFAVSQSLLACVYSLLFMFILFLFVITHRPSLRPPSRVSMPLDCRQRHLILVQYSRLSDISVQRYDFFLKNDATSLKKSHITRQTNILHGCHHVANVLLLFKKTWQR